MNTAGASGFRDCGENVKYKIIQVNLNKKELLTDAGKVVSGSVLMNAGMIVERPWGDFQGRLYWLEEC